MAIEYTSRNEVRGLSILQKCKRMANQHKLSKERQQLADEIARSLKK